VHFTDERVPAENVLLASDDTHTAVWVRR